MRGRKRITVCISLVILLIVAVGCDTWLSHATDTPASHTPTPSASTLSNARDGQIPSPALIECVLDGHVVTGCSGTTTMNGQTCTVSQEKQTHQITLQCK